MVGVCTRNLFRQAVPTCATRKGCTDPAKTHSGHTSCRVLGAVEAALAMEASWLNWAIVLMCGSHCNDGYKRSNTERWKLT